MDVRKHTMKEIDNNLLRDLKTGLQGTVILPGDPEYKTARKVWNGFVDRRPAVIVRCRDAADVVQALRFARSQGLDIAVRSGGHSTSGLSTIDGGMVIDVSPMKDVLVDADRRTALVGVGLTLGELIRATEMYGLATTTGTASETGMTGLTLGGGLGWLMGKCGLACDNVLSATVVTASGEILHASADENPELYWGLRGGGGNFGIVTSFEYQLYPISTVIGGMLVHPLSRAREVLRFYRDFADQTPDELTVFAAILTSPDGHPVVAIMPCWCGDLKEGERALEPLRAFGPPLADMVRPMPYAEMITLIDEGNPSGRNYYDKGCTLRALSDTAIDLIIEAGASRPSPLTAILIQHIHGAAARVAPEATAFAARGNRYMPVFLASWESGPPEPYITWTRDVRASFDTLAEGATYINLMGTDEQNHVPQAYGPNYARLVALKRQYDPQNVFKYNLNIKP